MPINIRQWLYVLQIFVGLVLVLVVGSVGHKFGTATIAKELSVAQQRIGQLQAANAARTSL